MKKLTKISLLVSTLIPSIVFASAHFYDQPSPTGLGDILNTITKLLSSVIPILIIIAVIYFIWSVIQYTLSSDEEAKAGARKGIITGLIGLFIIISFWGIVRVVQTTFNVGGAKLDKQELPQVIFQ